MSTAAHTACPPGFSIIVPVLDEETLIAPFLRHLRERAWEAEIIVVDGGSRDGTVALAQGPADHVLHAPRGRARQMNAGAAAARGDVLWFLHADSELPADPLAAMTAALGDPRTVGGCFRLRFPRREWVYRVSDSLGNVAVDLFRIALGDHGIFCRRAAFEQVGGYPDVPLMEDANLYRALRRQGGRMRQLRAFIVSSPRRYEQCGPVRTTACYLLILALYVSGARMATLLSIYRRFVGSKPRKPLRDRVSPEAASVRVKRLVVDHFGKPLLAARTPAGKPPKRQRTVF